MVRALYVGRFSPPHYGHLQAIKHICENVNVKSLIIGIGSAQDSYTCENPLTGGERLELLYKMVRNEHLMGKRALFLIPLVDMNNNNLWVSQVKAICPRFSVIYTNNSLVRLLFENSGDQVEPIPLSNREFWSGAKIRERIIKGESWQEFVPPAVAEGFLQFGGVRRLQMLAHSDK